jgi:hypothetical protein
MCMCGVVVLALLWPCAAMLVVIVLLFCSVDVCLRPCAYMLLVFWLLSVEDFED